MFIECRTSKDSSSFLRSDTCSTHPFISGHIALRWSACHHLMEVLYTFGSSGAGIWLRLPAALSNRTRVVLKNGAPNAAIPLQRALSIHTEGLTLSEKDAIAPSAAIAC